MSRLAKAVLLSACLASPATAQGVLDLGRPASPEEIAAWDIDVRPDGMGLPEGRGDVLTGEEIFADKCAVCHGDFGEAVGRWPVLAGGFDTLDSEDPVKTVGSYWPYLSTVFDYVNRAMPFGDAQSLAPDEVYAITAYLLYVNDEVDEEFELTHENFSSVRLVNEDNFFFDDRPEVEYAAFTGEPCMTDCKESVEITGRARVVDVTPEDALARATAEVAAADAKPEAEEPVTVVAASETPDPELVAAGEKVFRKCKSCHVFDPGKRKTGPHLLNIAGRAIAGVDGYKYSKAMKAAGDEGRVWDDAELSAFLAKPKTHMKGTKMSFSGLKKEADIEAIIAYLKSIAE